jgi:hypothetical protein
MDPRRLEFGWKPAAGDRRKIVVGLVNHRSSVLLKTFRLRLIDHLPFEAQKTWKAS